jgi:hypothetical protein
MNVTFRLDRARGALFAGSGARFDPARRAWDAAIDASATGTGEAVDAVAAATWLQRESGAPLRVPIGVIGPREATPAQLAAAEAVGRGLGAMGLAIVCGGRHGVMEAVCRGAAAAGGTTIGILPDADPSFANPYVGVVIATGIGEARNALIARAAKCLVAIGDSYGTLSEVALGRQFGKRVIGLEGAARVEGVVHVADAAAALSEVALDVLAVDGDRPR